MLIPSSSLWPSSSKNISDAEAKLMLDEIIRIIENNNISLFIFKIPPFNFLIVFAKLKVSYSIEFKTSIIHFTKYSFLVHLLNIFAFSFHILNILKSF